MSEERESTKEESFCIDRDKIKYSVIARSLYTLIADIEDKVSASEFKRIMGYRNKIVNTLFNEGTFGLLSEEEESIAKNYAERIMH